RGPRRRAGRARAGARRVSIGRRADLQRRGERWGARQPGRRPVMTDSPTGAPIRTVGLRKTYSYGKGEFAAVDGLDLTVEPGRFYGLLGPNGAGKSTTIGMLTTRIRPTGGRAYIAGFDVVKNPVEVKRRIGVVTQQNTMDRSITVLENLEFRGRYFGMSAREARRRGMSLLWRFGI